MSFGAPPSSTGAPGEQTCGEAGCHDDGPNPTRRADHTLSIHSVSNGMLGNKINAGDTALISIHVADSGIRRFGFQLTAVDSHGKSIGSFVLTDPDNTQILQNNIAFTDREYVTYTKDGTLAKTVGNHQWSFKWIAPKESTGKVSFYLATVSANNDNRDKGDYVYLRDTTINIGATMSVGKQEIIDCKIKEDIMHIQNAGMSSAMNIISIDGSIVGRYNISQGESAIDISELAKGFYVLQFQEFIYPFIR